MEEKIKQLTLLLLYLTSWDEKIGNIKLKEVGRDMILILLMN